MKKKKKQYRAKATDFRRESFTNRRQDLNVVLLLGRIIFVLNEIYLNTALIKF